VHRRVHIGTLPDDVTESFSKAAAHQLVNLCEVERGTEPACESLRTAARAAGVPSRRRTPKLDDVVQAARDGHAGARQVLDDAGHMLGLGASYLVSILNPELVVVGGEAADAFEFLLDPLRGALAQDALEAEQVPVVASAIEGDAGVAGAVLLAFEAGVASAEVEA